MLRLAWASRQAASAIVGRVALPSNGIGDDQPATATAPPAPPGAIQKPHKLTLNLFARHRAILTKKQVEMVAIPGASGNFDVLPGHDTSISELKPGVVEVTISPGDVVKYFVRSGYAFVHSDSTMDLCVDEGVPVDELEDPEASMAKVDAEEEVPRVQVEMEKLTL